ncbi:MAG: response regulator transcription factor [Acidimicrobiia bacterium]|nr:response regulator transcription factor [Acidimicrobiia bacterium]
MAIESPTEKRLLRALVAEDDPGIRRLIAGMLELDGWEVRQASDGDEAVEMAAEWLPDALVIDVMMPNKDGITALREIREQSGGGGVGVVVVSAKASAEAEAMDAGSDDFVSKPFDPDDLSARARAAHRWHQQAAARG